MEEIDREARSLEMGKTTDMYCEQSRMEEAAGRRLA